MRNEESICDVSEPCPVRGHRLIGPNTETVSGRLFSGSPARRPSGRLGSEAIRSITGHSRSDGVQNVAFASASLFSKTFQIHRAVDAEKNVLVYTVVSTKLINGWPFNSVSVVPVAVR
jgi:hypothetical protein